MSQGIQQKDLTLVNDVDVPDHGSYSGSEGSDNSQADEPKELDLEKYIDYTEDDEGYKVINGFITLKETMGEGGFCKVKRAIGHYKDDDGEVTDIVPYAMKVYKKS